MKKGKKNKLFVVGCIALAVMLTFSTYISLVVFGVITEENKKGEQGNEGGYVVGGNNSATDGNTPNNEGGNNSYLPNFSQGGNDTSQGNGGNNQTQNTPQGNSSFAQSGKTEYYLNTKKTAKEVIDIYADIMNKTKLSKPAFTKIEYQELPDDSESRVISEGADSVETVFGFIKSLGLIVDKDTAYKEPLVHKKGDEMKTSFPVFGRDKGSYLTDANGVKNYTYQKLKNGNIKLTFTLVDEKNPEPIGENSNVAPSYTGAVFAPMSKQTIDGTINHPIVKAFSKDIKYTLIYHDCKVEMVFNPATEQIVTLNHFADVRLSGTGNVVLGGVMTVEKQELKTIVLIKDFEY